MKINKPVIAVFATTLIVASGCSGSEDEGVKRPSALSQANTATTGGKNAGANKIKVDKNEIIMEVVGGKKASITYMQGNDQSQNNAARLPWKKKFKADGSGFNLVSVVAQSKSNKESTKITCKVTVGGVVVKTNTSTGPFAMVSCAPDAF